MAPMRKCGDCQLCCKLMPVPAVPKVAGERCPHQRHKLGCAIYPKRPMSCAVWSCRWLLNDDTADLRRPDRSHYVIDVMPDYVVSRPDDGGPDREIAVLQVWVDPKFPEAHRDPALRAYLERHNVPALVRFDRTSGLLVAPPTLASDHQWHEVITKEAPNVEHSVEDIMRVMGASAA